MKGLKTKLALALTIFSSMMMLSAMPVYAQTGCAGQDPVSLAKCGASKTGTTTCEVKDADGNVIRTSTDPSQCVNNTIGNIINLLSFIAGVLAVIVIIFGGFRYLTSAGDTAKVTAAKNTILYGLIGLIVVLFAQVIVRFVLGKL